MFELSVMTTFFGWCSSINIGILLFSFLLITLFRDVVVAMQSKLMRIEPAQLPILYFQYLGLYKMAIIIFNVVPYLALKLMV